MQRLYYPRYCTWCKEKYGAFGSPELADQKLKDHEAKCLRNPDNYPADLIAIRKRLGLDPRGPLSPQ